MFIVLLSLTGCASQPELTPANEPETLTRERVKWYCEVGKLPMACHRLGLEHRGQGNMTFARSYTNRACKMGFLPSCDALCQINDMPLETCLSYRETGPDLDHPDNFGIDSSDTRALGFCRELRGDDGEYQSSEYEVERTYMPGRGSRIDSMRSNGTSPHLDACFARHIFGMQGRPYDVDAPITSLSLYFAYFKDEEFHVAVAAADAEQVRERHVEELHDPYSDQDIP